MTSNKANRNRVDVRIQVEAHTTDGEVYRYLLTNPNWDLKHGRAMISQAVKDYWLADTRHEADPELAKTTAMACIERMEHRIAQLRQRFGLELPQSSLSTQSDVVKLLAEFIAEVKMMPQSLAAIATAISNTGGMVPTISATLSVASVVADDPIADDTFSDESVDTLLDILGELGEDVSADPSSEEIDEKAENSSEKMGL